MGFDPVDEEETCDNLFQSVQQLRPLSSENTCRIGFSSPISGVIDDASTTMSSEDLGLLQNATISNPLENDLILSDFGSTASALSISCEEMQQQVDQTGNWKSPADETYRMWRFQDFEEEQQIISYGTDDLLQKSESMDAPAECAHTESHYGINTLATPTDGASANLLSASDQSGVSILDSSVKRGLLRDVSDTDLRKYFDSSDNSDSMEGIYETAKSSSRKGPMSKNLVSERKRRKKLNERLYSLRAIVPKISKMDKASIVGDAINYVRDLQKQVEDMQMDIKSLQANKDRAKGISKEPILTASGQNVSGSQETPVHNILELEVSQMTEQTYHLRIHCKNRPGILVQLAQSFEALDFDIVNANLTSISDHILNTIVVKVKGAEGLKSEQLRKMTLDVIPKFGLHL
eukprot:c25292_g2_i2 orf=232-1449(+)